MNADTAFRRARRHLPPRLALSGRMLGRDAVEVAAYGSRVSLSDGRTVLDFGSYGVTLLGHGHPAVVATAGKQLEILPTATRMLTNPWTADAAAGVVDYLGCGLSRVYFGGSGADVVEAAVKLARLASGRPRVLAVRGAFHGKTLGALALTHNDRFRTGLEDVLPAVTHIAPEDPQAVAREVAYGDVAALIFEPVQGEGGVRPLDPDILRTWCAAAAQAGTFVIADEIQTGLRRCGERSMAVAAGLPVDAVLLGKPLGGGVLPISAAVCGDRLYEPLVADPMRHTATFSGHPLACAVVPTALAAIEATAHRGPVIAAAMGEGLDRLRAGFPDQIRAVRGRGLLWGIELASESRAGALIVHLARTGLLVSPCMSSPQTLRLLPPMVAEDAEIHEAMTIITAGLADRTT